MKRICKRFGVWRDLAPSSTIVCLEYWCFSTMTWVLRMTTVQVKALVMIAQKVPTTANQGRILLLPSGISTQCAILPGSSLRPFFPLTSVPLEAPSTPRGWLPLDLFSWYKTSGFSGLNCHIPFREYSRQSFIEYLVPMPAYFSNLLCHMPIEFSLPGFKITLKNFSGCVPPSQIFKPWWK